MAASPISSAWDTSPIPAPRSLPSANLDEARARERADAWGAKRVYTDLDALLADPEIDAVEILTPHQHHAEQAQAALAAGKHVSLQKPPTRTLAEFDAVAAAARESGRTLRQER